MSGFIKLGAGILIMAVIGLFLGIPIWLLWNWVMPEITIEPFFNEITLFQAMGLGILSSIMFKSTGSDSKSN